MESRSRVFISFLFFSQVNIFLTGPSPTLYARYSIVNVLLHPTSSGSICLGPPPNDGLPNDYVNDIVINPNYLHDESDTNLLLHSLKESIKISKTTHFGKYEPSSVNFVEKENPSDEELIDFIKNNCESANNLVCFVFPSE